MTLILCLLALAIVVFAVLLQRSRGAGRKPPSREDGSSVFLFGVGDGGGRSRGDRDGDDRGRSDHDGDGRSPDSSAGDGGDSGGGGDGGGGGD